MMRNVWLAAFAAISLLQVSSAHGHFVWASFHKSPDGARKLHVYMSEAASPETAKMTGKMPKPTVWLRDIAGASEETPVVTMATGSSTTLVCDAGKTVAVAEAKCVFGVFEKGDKAWLMHYYAKAVDLGQLNRMNRKSPRLDLDIYPTFVGDVLYVATSWKGKAAVDCQVVVIEPDGKRIERTTDDRGLVTLENVSHGRFAIRARKIEKEAGLYSGRKYDQRRHYCSLTLEIDDESGAANAPPIKSEYPLLERGITSFGGAIVGDWLYTYGGHFGRAHHYHKKSQSNQLNRLNLKTRHEWETVATGPRRQGLAMVAHNGILYRVGGFIAKNDDGGEHELESTADFYRFDPKVGKWQRLTPLPEPRSSHDAVVIGDKLYVVGGWQLGGDKPHWHETAWVVDLSHEILKWKPLPKPTFQRRAISLAYLDNHLFAIGGMQAIGGPTTRVDKLDLKTGSWSEAKNMVGEGMEGFGSSAYTVGDTIFVSTYGGNVQVLETASGDWRIFSKLKDDRFFHRMLPYQDRLILVGGASMVSGKRLHIETVPLSPANAITKSGLSAKSD